MGNTFITSDGVGIKYEYYFTKAFEHTNKIPLVFLNGIFMHYESWKLFTKDISEKMPLLFHNFRCQWDSDCEETKECSFERHVQDLKELLDHLGIKKAKFVGTSYGGEVAMLFGVFYPQYVETMMIITSTARTDKVMESKAIKWKDGAKTKNPESFVHSWLTDVYSEKYINSFDNLVQIISSRLNGFNYRGAERLIDAFLDLNSYDLLNRIKDAEIPLVVVSAEFDRIKPKSFSQEIYNSLKKGVHITIPDSGHAVVVEKPKEIGWLIRNFAFDFWK